MPCVGKLLTNRSGRIEFVFDPLLLDFFVSQREMVVREVSRAIQGVYAVFSPCYMCLISWGH